MKISVTDAKSRLTELVQEAESGEDVLLTRDGRVVVRLVPERRRPTPEEKRAVMERVRRAGRAKTKADPEAARSQDFLYNEVGLPK